ncbi:RNA polymerase sigma factor SigX [Lysobacter enzymogenes]|uniref:RNA polymerase sigma factor SigX n=1 Tax=Lysobacter enzymogenes TaxID=69 RepID=A0A0S2DBF3_LYSEN|nr:sigma-70 family RNA polymerase sigma factor [Lysobacter enzymogenes]ALN55868.1 RNA polymerase sigma factor SigX [Lysobacter enzymogenes]
MSASEQSRLAESLARQYGRLVFQAAYRVLGDAAQAEDVQQEVFLRLLQSDGRDAIESWPAYLSAAASRAAIDVLRRQRRWWRALPLWRAQQPGAAESAEQANLHDERARRLRQALAGLPRREAQCFGLRYLEGMEIDQIARSLRLSANNVNVILHRARRRLEAELAERGDTTEIAP